MVDISLNPSSLVVAGGIVNATNPLPVSVVGSAWSSTSFANIGSASTAGAGASRYVTDAPGFVLTSNGTRWRGSFAAKTMDADSAAVQNTNTVVFQYLFPAGFLQVGDHLRFRTSLNKNGATDSTTLSIYVGTLGTASDATIITSGVMIAANRSVAIATDLRVFSATAISWVNNSGATTGNTWGYSSVTNNAVVGPVSLAGTDTTANALFFSAAILTGSTNTTIMRDAQLDYLSATG